MKRILPIIIMNCLLGCSSSHKLVYASTKEAMQRANELFVGKNIDEFILVYGIPNNKYQLNNKNYVYAYTLGLLSRPIPTKTYTTGHIGPYGSYWGSSTTRGGGTANCFCEIQVATTVEGEILFIESTRDTQGIWTTSRCSEVFKEKLADSY